MKQKRSVTLLSALIVVQVIALIFGGYIVFRLWQPNPAFTIAKPGAVTAAGLTVTMDDPAAVVEVTDAQLAGKELEYFERLAGASLVTWPFKLSADSGSGGHSASVVQKLPAALEPNQAAYLVMWDNDSGEWVPIESTISEDRTSVTAEVTQLSTISTFVSPVFDAASGTFKRALETPIGATAIAAGGAGVLKQNLDNAASALAEKAKTAGDTSGDAEAALADELAGSAPVLFSNTTSYVQEGIEQPSCDAETPDWYTPMEIRNAGEGTGIKYCVSGVAGDPNRIEVKLAVSRLTPYLISVTDHYGHYSDPMVENPEQYLENTLGIENPEELLFPFIGEEVFLYPGVKTSLILTRDDVEQAGSEMTASFIPVKGVPAIVQQSLIRGLELESAEDLFLASVGSFMAVAENGQNGGAISDDVNEWSSNMSALIKKAAEPLQQSSQSDFDAKLSELVSSPANLLLLTNEGIESQLEVADAQNGVQKMTEAPAPEVTNKDSDADDTNSGKKATLSDGEVRSRFLSVDVPQTCDHPAGTLENGWLEDPAGSINGSTWIGDYIKGNGSPDTITYVTGAFVQGDTAEYYALEVNCYMGGVGWPSEIVIYDQNFNIVTSLGNNNRPDAMKQHRGPFVSISANGDKLSLEWFAWGEGSFGAHATEIGSGEFQVVGDELKLIDGTLSFRPNDTGQ